uniref:Uncharacterized protein n=1 Tax=Oryza nivara TaxID=4536 RepID=A0A0E0HLB5_ORYNI
MDDCMIMARCGCILSLDRLESAGPWLMQAIVIGSLPTCAGEVAASRSRAAGAADGHAYGANRPASSSGVIETETIRRCTVPSFSIDNPLPSKNESAIALNQTWNYGRTSLAS